MARRRHKRPLLSALALVVFGATWLLFAPTAVGGQASYVVINGNSMEPGMHRGDLAILRTSDVYAVGEVVTYRHPEIGPVIHRIIGRTGEHFVFQGDNNSFIDPYTPGQDELIGRLWLFIPRAGALLIFLRQPPVFAGLAALVIGIATMATGPLPLARRDSRPAQAQPSERAALLNGAVTFALALGLAALGLAAVAFGRPTTHTVEQSLSYTQRASFDYGAPGPAELYDGGAAGAGDSIFRQLTDSVAITATYSFEAAVPVRLAGTARLLLIVGDSAGWQRSLPLGPETPFDGQRVTLTGALDLPAIEAILRTYEDSTGLRQATYQLTVRPVYTVQGSVGGAPLATVYSPELAFSFDKLRLRPQLEQTDGQLVAEEAGSLATTKTTPNSLNLWLLRLDVLTGRRLALAGLEIALVIGAVAGWLLARELRRDPLAALRLRSGAQLLRAPRGGAWTRDAIVLSTLGDLTQVAERSGQPIIQVERGIEAGYYVRSGELVYTWAGPAGRPEEE